MGWAWAWDWGLFSARMIRDDDGHVYVVQAKLWNEHEKEHIHTSPIAMSCGYY